MSDKNDQSNTAAFAIAKNTIDLLQKNPKASFARSAIFLDQALAHVRTPEQFDRESFAEWFNAFRKSTTVALANASEEILNAKGLRGVRNEKSGGFAKYARDTNKPIFAVGYDTLATFFARLQELGLDEEFAALCRNPEDLVPRDTADKYLKWLKHHPSPAATVPAAPALAAAAVAVVPADVSAAANSSTFDNARDYTRQNMNNPAEVIQNAITDLDKLKNVLRHPESADLIDLQRMLRQFRRSVIEEQTKGTAQAFNDSGIISSQAATDAVRTNTVKLMKKTHRDIFRDLGYTKLTHFFEHLQANGLDTEFAEICSDRENFVPIDVAQTFKKWHKNHPTPAPHIGIATLLADAKSFQKQLLDSIDENTETFRDTVVHPESYGIDRFNDLFAILKKTVGTLTIAEMHEAMVADGALSNESGTTTLSQFMTEKNARVFDVDEGTLHTFFARLQELELGLKFAEICCDPENLIPPETATKYIGWWVASQQAPAQMVDAAAAQAIDADGDDAPDDVQSAKRPLGRDGFQKATHNFVSEMRDLNKLENAIMRVKVLGLHEAEEVDALLQGMTNPAVLLISSEIAGLSESAIRSKAKLKIKEIFKIPHDGLMKFFEFLRESGSEQKFEELSRNMQSLMPMPVRDDFRKWQKRNPAPAATVEPVAGDADVGAPQDDAPMSAEAIIETVTLAAVAPDGDSPDVVIVETTAADADIPAQEAPEPATAASAASEGAPRAGDDDISHADIKKATDSYKLEILDHPQDYSYEEIDSLLDCLDASSEMVNYLWRAMIVTVSGHKFIPDGEMPTGFASGVRSDVKKQLGNDYNKREAFFKRLQELGLDQKFLRLCNDRQSYIPDDLKYKFKTWLKYNPTPVVAAPAPVTVAAPSQDDATASVEAIAAPAPAADADITVIQRVVPSEEEFATAAVANSAATEPVIPDPVIHIVDGIQIIEVGRPLVVPGEQDELLAVGSRGRGISVENPHPPQPRRQWLLETLLESGVERDDIVVYTEHAAGTRTDDYPYEVIEFIKDDINAQVLVCDYVGFATYVLKTPINMWSNDVIQISELKDNPAAFKVVLFNREQWAANILEIAHTDLEKLTPQINHVMAWRDKKRALEQSMIVNTGTIPRAVNDPIQHGELAGRTTWSRANSALNRDQIAGLEESKNLIGVYNRLLSRHPELSSFLGAAPIQAAEVFRDAVGIAREHGEVPQPVLFGVMNDMGITIAGRKPEEVELAFRFNAVRGAEAASTADYMLIAGIAQRNANGDLVVTSPG